MLSYSVFIALSTGPRVDPRVVSSRVKISVNDDGSGLVKNSTKLIVVCWKVSLFIEIQTCPC